MKWIIREQQISQSAFNAGSKARNDVDTILVAQGFKPLHVEMPSESDDSIIRKLASHIEKYGYWKKAIDNIQEKDELIIQYPVRSHSVLFSNALRAVKKKDVKIVGIIHDLESLRLAISESESSISKVRLKLEELSALKYFDKIIVHNEHMRKAIHKFFYVPMDKMITLEMFDYLYEPVDEEEHAVFGGPVLIAGNLDKNKCGYVYDLPSDVQFDLYGANYDEDGQQGENVRYRGKVKPDELPGVLKGSFGLVWDGPTGDGCKGVFGEYLKYNNPHKASLYLASGIPIIVWNESALADFVNKHVCGICVESLYDLGSALKLLKETNYMEMRSKAAAVGKRLRGGEYTKKAIEICDITG